MSAHLPKFLCATELWFKTKSVDSSLKHSSDIKPNIILVAGIKHDDGGGGGGAAAAVAAIATGEVEISDMVMFVVVVVCFGTSRGSSTAATAGKSVKCKIFRLTYKALNSTLLIFK